MDVINNKTQKQFELKVDGHVAKIEYSIQNDKIYLNSTQVPEELSGQGIGSKLVKQSLELIQDMGLNVVPICSFIQAWFKRHPENNDMLA